MGDTPQSPSVRALVLALGLAVSCGDESAETSPAPASAAERASALLEEGAVLPPRVDVVALSNEVAMASVERDAPGQAELTHLAARLRERLWRLDQAAADGREAVELFGATARAAAGTPLGCESDRARALLMGELERSASLTYREAYLGSRRQHAITGADEASQACLDAFEADLARAVSFRPTTEAMALLEKEGDREVATAREMVGRDRPGALTSAAVAPSRSPATGPAPKPDESLVVRPDEKSLPEGPVSITSIEPYGSEKGARIVVHLSGPATFDVGTLDPDADAGKDRRIYVDIKGARTKGIARDLEVGGVVRRVRVGKRKEGARVVLDLATSLYRRVFYLPHPFRIVIDVSTRPPVVSSPSQGGKRAVRRVVIDPGHGGEDSGAVGPTGLAEKDVALDIAHRVAPVLAHELKVDTMLTRDSDVFVPLDERTARANAFHADLFISIHCNASEDGEAHGVQTYVLDEARESDRAAIMLAAKENAIRIKGKAIDAEHLDAEMGAIASRMSFGGLRNESVQLATLLQRSTMSSLSQRYPDALDGGIRRAGFFVLVGADMPAVLFETSFISHPEEESRLSTADYRQKMADAIVNAVRAYREGK